MNQSELIDKVAQATALSQAAAGQAVKAVVNAILDSLVAGEAVRVSGLGTFNVAGTACTPGAQSTKRTDDKDRRQQSRAVPPWQSCQGRPQSAARRFWQDSYAVKEIRDAEIKAATNVSCPMGLAFIAAGKPLPRVNPPFGSPAGCVP